MKLVFNNAKVFENGHFVSKNICLSADGTAVASAAEELSFDSVCLLPGLLDVHVHFREPGFSYKETVSSGSRAAARGGYCAVFTMPNLNPAPDSLENLRIQQDAIDSGAVIRVLPYGTITVGQKGEALSDMDALAPHVCAFTDDGRGVQSDEMMRAAMKKAKSLGKMICAHCEDNSLLRGGYIHDGEYARRNGHRGICSESEWRQIARDLALVCETGCSYHVCHVSAKESVALIREAKREGLDVSCETGPHYLILTDEDLQEDGRFKMNPPLRSAADRDALIEGILDGTVDMIATDHAPHSAEEKSRGLAGSAMGVVGLETAVAELYTHLVRPGIITLEKLVHLMHTRPAERFGITLGDGCCTAFDFNTSYTVDPSEFVSMGKSTPFAGDVVYGRCKITVCDGKIAWLDKSL